LGSQVLLQNSNCDGWAESDIDEIVAVLDAVYARRETAQTIGQTGANVIGELAWSHQIDKLVATVAGAERTNLQSQLVA
jgi:hypothetical protein